MPTQFERRLERLEQVNGERRTVLIVASFEGESSGAVVARHLRDSPQDAQADLVVVDTGIYRN
jgi:hypothetical protein